MRQILKGKEPHSLAKHRATGGIYDAYRDTDGLRAALVDEQRGLCCYCMRRISEDGGKMKIEHWHCTSRYPDEELDYGNLLGACKGGEGSPYGVQHCDTRKANRDLQWNPADPRRRIEERIKYGADGTIRSTDATFDDQLNDVLNLNVSHIKDRRRAVQDGIVKWFEVSRRRKRSMSRSRLRAKIDKLSCASPMDAYGPVVIWWLERRLARMNGD